MNLRPLLCLAALAVTLHCPAQHSGNIAYGQPYGRLRPDQAEREKRTVSPAETPPTNAMFLDANVLINVLADEYVAVFAVAQEGETPADCAQKMDALLTEFLGSLKPLGVASNDFYVDFIAQEKIYGYHVQDNVAKEQLNGFELKKNVSIHYRDKNRIDALMQAAAKVKIYDLVKVDYVVANPGPIQDRLMQQAAQVIKHKAAAYEELFGIKLAASPQVYAHKPAAYFPSELYDTYTAAEGERVERPMFQQRYTIQDLRKSRTFYFNPLNPGGFDTVINPVVIEPVVQFTLYLKLKYDLDVKSNGGRIR